LRGVRNRSVWLRLRSETVERLREASKEGRRKLSFAGDGFIEDFAYESGELIRYERVEQPARRA
jgi:hypothetical protein